MVLRSVGLVVRVVITGAVRLAGSIRLAWSVRVEPGTGVVVAVLVMIPLLVSAVGCAPASLAVSVLHAVSTVLHFPSVPV